MGLDVYSRREYRQGKFVYLLDDEEKTAWIAKGHIGRCRRYRLPDHVMVDGERYTVESVELGAYNYPRTLRHLVFPDTFVFVDCDTLYGLDNLCSIHIGKGVELLTSWNFRLCPKLHNIHIDKDNPHIKYESGMVLSKDGKKLWASFVERPHVVIPEGVEEVNQYTFSGCLKMETLTLPSTLLRTRDNSFSCCTKLRSVIFPERFERCGTQSFMEGNSLTNVDLPSTLIDLGFETFVDCLNLRTVVLRSPQKIECKDSFGAWDNDIPLQNAILYVPADLVEQYLQDPEWSVFKHIFAIEKYANYEIPFQTLSAHDEVFDLDKIPMDVLDKGWKRYRPYLLKGDEQHPLNFGRPVGGDTPFAVLQNIKILISNTFEIDKKQFVIIEDDEKPSISILIALCDNNVEVMEAAMQTQGCFKEAVACAHLLEDRKGRRWMNVRFKIKDRPHIQSAWDCLREIENKPKK